MKSKLSYSLIGSFRKCEINKFKVSQNWKIKVLVNSKIEELEKWVLEIK